jgi:NAD(P)-dependent dehydrogenase (short-subunit alcohol dehydrogenase family)
MDFAQSVAVVSGGASGLGEAFVRMLVKAGGRAAILDFDQDKGEKLASELGQEVIFCRTDVTKELNVQDAVKATMEAFGVIHCVVNCAGVVSPGKERAWGQAKY